MKIVYDANQLGEAYIIKHLLERAGLFAAIHGEYLQGGAGELAASGFIKVVVHADDVTEAESIIQAWDHAEWDKDAWRNEAK